MTRSVLMEIANGMEVLGSRLIDLDTREGRMRDVTETTCNQNSTIRQQCSSMAVSRTHQVSSSEYYSARHIADFSRAHFLLRGIIVTACKQNSTVRQ